MPAAGANHPIETPVRRTPLKIGTTTATESSEAGWLLTGTCLPVVGEDCRAACPTSIASPTCSALPGRHPARLASTGA